MSGIFYDIIERLATDIDVNIEWLGETTWGTMVQDLKDDKCDLVVTGVFPTAPRAKEVTFTRSVIYIGMGAVIRKGDKRFKTVEDFNQPNVTIATIDGEVGDVYVRQYLPKANRIAIPTGEIALAVDQVAYNKADVAITDMLSAARYVSKNKDNLRIIPFEFMGLQ
jgi:ABC-type amino acid transport substrate-binding protein